MDPGRLQSIDDCEWMLPIYNALDPETHFEVARTAAFEADLSLLANRLPDREARIDAFFFEAISRTGASVDSGTFTRPRRSGS